MILSFGNQAFTYTPNVRVKKNANANTCSCWEEHPEDSEKGLAGAVIWQSVVPQQFW